MISFSALALSLTTKVYRYYMSTKEQSTYLAATDLQLSLTRSVLLDLDHYKITQSIEWAYSWRPFFWQQ